MNETSTWTSFFTATAGASATLTGLVFVGVSFSLPRIITEEKLSHLALEAFSFLTSILIISLITLIPFQSLRSVGLEMLFVTLLLEVLVVYLNIDMLRSAPQEFKARHRRNFIVNQLIVLPIITITICILSGYACGFLWLALALIALFVKSLSDAWVILIEIHR